MTRYWLLVPAVGLGAVIFAATHPDRTAPVFRVPSSCSHAASTASAVIAADNRREPLVAREVDAAWHGRQLRLFVPAKDPRTPDLTSCGVTR